MGPADFFSNQKRENSPVPLPSTNAQLRSTAETLDSRVARGDFAAVRALMEGCVASLEAWQKTIESMPNPSPDSPEGSSVAAFKSLVAPRIAQLALVAKARLPPK